MHQAAVVRNLRLSFFGNAKDNQIKRETLSIPEFIEALTRDPELVPVPADASENELKAIKEGTELVFPGSFAPDAQSRSKGSVDKIECMFLDFDGSDKQGLTPEQAEALFLWLENTEYLHVSYNSFSSGFCTPNEKLRVVLFFERPVTPDEFTRTWIRIASELPVAPDPTCKQAHRCYFTPRIAAQHKNLYQSSADGFRLLRVPSGLNLNEVDLRRQGRDWDKELQTCEDKYQTMISAAFRFGVQSAQAGKSKQESLNEIWARIKNHLSVNRVSAPVRSWTSAERSARGCAAAGFDRGLEEKNEAPSAPSEFVATAKQLAKATRELTVEIKNVTRDPRGALSGAAFRLGRFVPHVLTEARVRRELLKAATQAEQDFINAGEADPIVTVGIAAGSQKPLFVRGAGWRSRLHYDENDIPTASEINAKTVFEFHPEMAGKLRYHVREAAAVLTDSPPWDNQHAEFPAAVDTPDGYDAARWLAGSDVLGKAIPPIAAREALIAVAQQDPFDPFKEWLLGLNWDGVPRLDTWLQRFARAEDSRFTGLVSAKFLIGAVARTMQPNAKVDSVLVLVGPERRGKSLLLQTLAGPGFFTDELQDITNKDAHLLMERFVIVEIAELDKLMLWDDSQVKSFITAQAVQIRAAYARVARLVQRRAVLAASTNEYEFLKSATGNRRFWPVLTESFCDLAGCAREREQLWAEARARFDLGECWWFENEADYLEAEEKQEQARVKDEMEHDLDFLEGKRPSCNNMFGVSDGVVWFNDQFEDDGKGRFMWVTNKQVCQRLGLDYLKKNEQMRVTKMLRARKWIGQQERFHGTMRRVYRRPI